MITAGAGWLGLPSVALARKRAARSACPDRLVSALAPARAWAEAFRRKGKT